MYKKLLSISAIGLLLFSCEQSGSNMEQDFNSQYGEGSDSTAQVDNSAISVEEAEALLNSVPPPLELASLIKKVGGEYSSAPLNPTTNVQKYSTNFSKAINLGVYGADLGYANIYSQTQDAFSYLGAVRDLAEKLNVGQFFDFETIKKLASNSDNLDSLLTISTSNFTKMNSYLREQQRINLSVLMMTGGYVEGLHIACHVAKTKNSQELNERIGEQKIAMEQIMILLGMFKNDPSISSLYADMEKLDKLFQQVQITEVEGGTETQMIDGIPIEVSLSTSQVTISPELLEEIRVTTEEIRSKFIN